MKPTKNHARMSGIRICVHKPENAHKPRSWTTIYVNSTQLSSLLELTDGDVGAVTHTARCSSLRCMPKSDEAWSQTVLADAHKVLRRDRTRRAQEAAAAAALENNLVWEQQ